MVFQSSMTRIYTENDDFQLKELFDRVRVYGSPNFLGAHIPLNIQLNVEKW